MTTSSTSGSNVTTTSTTPVGVTVGGGSSISGSTVTLTNCNNPMSVVVPSGNGSQSVGPQQQQQVQTPQSNPTTTSAPQMSNVTTSTSLVAGNSGSAVTTVTAVSGSAGSGSNSNQGSMSIKEEPNIIESSIQIKREDESPHSVTPPGISGSGVNIKKEPIQLMNTNGSGNTSSIIGSTNTGSLHHNEKTSNESNPTEDLLATKDELLSDNQTGIVTMQSMVSIKKEEPGPDLTPDGFGPLGPVIPSSGGGNNGSVSNNSGSGGSNNSNTNIQANTGNNNNRIQPNTSPTESVQQLQGNIMGNTKQSGSSVSGMDYMQQQSHIFVFSTKLANKGAESVLSGQYPTIIAYHCAQPSTKKFLEDFFHKNPLKLSKINRQNPAQWMNNNMPLSNKAKSNNNSNGNSNNSNRMIPTTKSQSTCNTNFTTDDLPSADPELMPWEQSGNHLILDTISNGSGSNTNVPSNADVSLEVDNLVPGSPSLNPNRSCSNHMPISSTTATNMQQSPTTNTTSSIGPTSPSLSGGLQPSLQGVKVPDENLTPQQRQHREEQLAKLKKMNQFLFPEQGGIGPEFMSGVPPDGVEPNLPSGKIMGPAGNSGPVGMMGQLQIPGGMGPGIRGSNMMGMGPRVSLCRPMGPMCPNPMQDTMMGGGSGVPPNNPGLNEMGISCGMVPGMLGGQQQQGNMIGGPPNLGQQPMVQGNGPMTPCGLVGQNKHPMSGLAQMEWSKLQQQFYEERKGKGMEGLSIGGMCPGNMPGVGGGRQLPSAMRSNHQSGSRSQGPPPPYHQTQRSASVPIATQSPNPGSPNNPTSNLSLPSPRAGSTLNSPAGDNNASGNSAQGVSNNSTRQQMSFKQDSPVTGSGSAGGGGNGTSRSSLSHNSNPSTPISSHLSPNATSLKELELGNTSVANQGKEPNLMPVPSPQQIQYLNTFEGQELTIQKQPNTTLKDGGGIISPPGGGSSGAGNSGGPGDNRLSGSSTPLTPSSMEPRFPANPGAGGGGTNQVSVGGIVSGGTPSSFPIPSSPQTPNAGGAVNSSQNNGDKGQRIGSSGPSPQGSRTPSMSDSIQNSNNMSSSVDTVRFTPASPGINFSGSSQSNNQPNSMKMTGFMDVSPTGKCSTSTNDAPSNGNFCVRADNLPLNPNSSCPPPAKTSHFDPISSLAQMSQQLTSSVPSSLNGQPPNGGPGSSGNGNGGGGVVNPGGTMMTNFQSHGGMGLSNDMSMGGHHVDGLMGNMDACGMGGVMPGMAQYSMGGGGIPLGMMGGPGPRSISPKLGSGMVGFPGGPVGIPHRMIGRPPMGGSPYNGANIQVKASTPNTIQYLPARPQVGNPNPRGPPSLEFLRYTNPMSAMDGPNKMPSGQSMPFYPNCNQMGQPGPGGMGMGGHMDTSGGMGGGDGSGMINMGAMGPGGPMGMGQNMIMRGLRPPGQGAMVRMSGPPHMGGGGGGGAHHHHPFSNGPPNGGPNDPSLFANNQMFVTNAKGNPMNSGSNIPGGGGPGGGPHPSQMGGGVGPPDATQPLPPSMGGQPPGGSFKSSQFVGPSTADPNYAQQYHNFQQQLYATSTRSQLSSQSGGGGGMTPGPNNPNQQSFFVPK